MAAVCMQSMKVHIEKRGQGMVKVVGRKGRGVGRASTSMALHDGRCMLARRRNTRGSRRIQSPRNEKCSVRVLTKDSWVQKRRTAASAGPISQEVSSVATVFEAGVQVSYLLLLVLVVGGIGWVGLQQLLIRRNLDNAAKDLQEKVRTGEATAEEYFQYGAIMIEKEYFSLAARSLKTSLEKWEGDDEEKGQIHNALGFAFQKLEKFDDAVQQFSAAVELVPDYVVAWRNLGDVFEKKKMWKEAVVAYERAVSIAPGDKIANERLQYAQRVGSRRGAFSD